MCLVCCTPVCRVPSYSGATFRDTFLYEVTDAKNSTTKMARVVVNVGEQQRTVYSLQRALCR